MGQQTCQIQKKMYARGQKSLFGTQIVEIFASLGTLILTSLHRILMKLRAITKFSTINREAKDVSEDTQRPWHFSRRKLPVSDLNKSHKTAQRSMKFKVVLFPTFLRTYKHQALNLDNVTDNASPKPNVFPTKTISVSVPYTALLSHFATGWI